MNYKNIILISIIALIILSSFSVVSAGWFDFLNSEPEPTLNQTGLQCWGLSSGGINFRIFTTNDDIKISNKDNITVQVNITDENNNTNSLNISDWVESDIYGLNHTEYMDFGTYNVSMYFPGNDIFNASSWNGTIVIKPNEDADTINHSDSDSNNTVSDKPLFDRSEVDIAARGTWD